MAAASVCVLLIWLAGWWIRGWRVRRLPPWPEPPRRRRPYLAEVGQRAEDIVQVEAARMMASGEMPFDRDST